MSSGPNDAVATPMRVARGCTFARPVPKCTTPGAVSERTARVAWRPYGSSVGGFARRHWTLQRWLCRERRRRVTDRMAGSRTAAAAIGLPVPGRAAAARRFPSHRGPPTMRQPRVPPTRPMLDRRRVARSDRYQRRRGTCMCVCRYFGLCESGRRHVIVIAATENVFVFSVYLYIYYPCENRLFISCKIMLFLLKLIK